MLAFLMREAEKLVCAILFLGMTLLGFANVVVRYGTSYSFASSEELLTNGFLLLTVFGAAIAARQGQHLAVTAVVDLLPRSLRLPLVVLSAALAGVGATVANHVSWLDIFALNAAQRGYFVAKAEVEGWAGIGWLARATGTVFIARRGIEAKVQQQVFEDRIRAGHRLIFFPEGTSTDALRVLPFKSTLFAAFWTHGLEHVMAIQPVTLAYHAPAGADARFYGWWGEMDFAGHLLQVLARPLKGRVEVIFHDPVRVDAFADRKALAAHCEAEVRAAHAAALGPAAV